MNFGDIYVQGIIIISSVRKGERRHVPAPQIGKTVVGIWSYLPEVYPFRSESEIQEIYSKKF